MGSSIVHYSIVNPADAMSTALRIARAFPDSEDAAIGVFELLLNAIEHGNLGIGYDLKTRLVRYGRWQEEVARRLTLPEYAKKRVDICLEQDAGKCKMTITDEGDGFNWRDYLNRAPSEIVQKASELHGRGLFLVQQCKFDNVSFNEKGNSVVCVAQK